MGIVQLFGFLGEDGSERKKGKERTP